MFSIISTKDGGYLPCPKESSPPISNECYSISLKKVLLGEVNYGRTKYDFNNGAMVFMSPRQVMQWDKVIIDQKGLVITFHEDFIRGTILERQIKKYGFFSYTTNEALHLSPKEEKLIESIFDNIEMEYHNNQDKFSKDIIIAQLGTLLKYADRFYERQFINRKELSGSLLEKFTNEIRSYFESDKLQELGIPTIEALADSLSVSQRYLSDTLKKETGKTAIEHIHLYLIDEAKNILLQPNKTISQIAYELGFEYPQYFSRLFKKRVGVSPSHYRNKFMLN
nr:helix-turn-helix transcriptional regulator [Aureispira anguillae]